jgi:uncharacterized protein YyaL (SSP411 family)
MKFRNKLSGETSPYLLQHASNPVDWYPWGRNALEKSKRENKLLIVSIGYAACHWCHVMEHESFEDEIIAKVMNDFFVSIKVDREERPDIDQIYMDAAYFITGRGGWPLNVIALPDGRPVFAGTYFRKDDWKKILLYFKDLYQKEPETFNTEAGKLLQAIKGMKIPGLNNSDLVFTKEELEESYQKIISFIDFNNGGTKGAPKFPMPDIFQFLLAYHFHAEKKEAIDAVKLTLDKIARGGIYDHIDGGFARYSTDETWKVPHFEKMLYDNAELVSLYSNAYKITGNEFYKKIVYETLDFIEREMTDLSCGFYSSLDADSEGEEGKYYVWSKEEIDNLLKNNSEIFCDYYSITSTGNWEGKNILHITKSKEELLNKYQINEEQFDEIINSSKKILADERNKRIKPGLDDKILTSWNALMIKGFVDAFKAFGEKKFLNTAIANGNFILTNLMSKEGQLNRNYKNGKSTINAFLDDYAYTIEAFISLYEATFDEKWIFSAKKLADYVKLHFYDNESRMFYYTSDLDDPLITRKADLSDNVIPSSNSSLAVVLFKLSRIFNNEDYGKTAENLIKAIKQSALQNPIYHSNWLIAATYLSFPYFEIGIIGEECEKKKVEISKQYFPNIILFGSRQAGSLDILKGKYVEAKTTIYACENNICRLPVEDVDEAIKQIQKNAKSF